MHFYSPSPLSLGYIPRGTHRPAPVPTYIGGECSSALTLEGLGYPAYPHSFLPRLDAETRYRRAVHEFQAAGEEFEAQLTLRRARQATILREQAERRQRALAIQAEIERIERARALQVKLAEECMLHQRAHRAQAALDRARHRKHALLHDFVDPYPRDPCSSERPCAFAKKRRTHLELAHRPVFHGNEVATFDGLLKLFSGILPRPQSRSVEPQPSEEQDLAADSVDAVLEFLHNFAAHAKDAANGPEDIPKPASVPQSQATPVDGKGKGKAKAERTEPATGPRLLQVLLGALTQGSSDQESEEIELAIKLSLEDHDAADTKKASTAKAVRFTSGVSSRVKLDGAIPPSNTPSFSPDSTFATEKSIPIPVSPLTTIRAIRNRLSTVESTFKFPAVLDFDQSVLTVSPNNAPLRAFENTLNGLLEQLDAIKSDGDEEVRNTRREVVREVEKALENLERKVSEDAPKLQVTKDVEVKGYDVEAEELVQATFAAEGAEPTEPSAAVPLANVDVDLAVTEVPSPPAVKSPNSATAEPGNNTTAETIPSLDAVETAPVLGDSSKSVAMIKTTPVSGPSSDVYVLASPDSEAFLASMSHDQFTFPPKPSYSDSGESSAGVQDDVVLVGNSEEGESVKSGEEGWSQVDA